METSNFPASAHGATSSDFADKIGHLPETAQAAYRAFRASGDVTVLDPLICALLENYAPQKLERPMADHPGGTLLMEELGFDSLTITELVFYTEELFEINISNAEIALVRSIDDLRAFIRAKVSTPPTA